MAAKAKGVTGRVEFPAKLQFLFKKARYKVAHGGRGSSKSWSIARALLILGAKTPLRILCTREVQKSIKDSVHKLLSDQIKALGLSGKYEVLDTTIRGSNGTEFLFSGLSSVTAENIKSFESVDICWVEEGQTISKRSWDILTPTIRKEGSEIWISMNPELETDESYRRFVANPPPDSIVVQVNYQDNPWFSKELESERLHAKRTMSADDYENIWEGKCRKAAVGAIYAADITAAIKNGRVRPVPYDPLLKVHCIYDLGWNDALTIIMVQRAASELRVIDYIEGSHRTLASYVKGDPNDPELDYLEKRPWNWGKDFLPHDGFHKDYKTGKTSRQILEALGRKVHEEPVANIGIEEGIKAARATFAQVYFDDGEKVARLIECLRRYRRAINERTGEPGSPVHDEFSHGCLDGNTTVLTERGDVRIKDVQVGDRVWTPAGYARVLNSGPTKIADEIIEITMADGSILLATPEHKIFTTRGVVLADDLRYDDCIFNQWSHPCLPSQNIESMGYRGAVIASFEEIDTGYGSPGASTFASLEECSDCCTSIAGLRRLEGAGASRPVYDLTVEKHHCYLANGLLVSNSDAFRYMSIAAELLTNDRTGGDHPILQDPRFSAGRMPATSYGY